MLHMVNIPWCVNIIEIQDNFISNRLYQKAKNKLDETMLRIRKYHSFRVLIFKEDFEKARILLCIVSHSFVVWKMSIFKLLEALQTQHLCFYFFERNWTSYIKIYKQGSKSIHPCLFDYLSNSKFEVNLFCLGEHINDSITHLIKNKGRKSTK